MGHRNFLLLWSAQGISAVGSRITRTALPMAAILAAGASAIDLGLLTLALTLPGVAIAVFAGGWVDRHRRKPLLITADLLRAAALLAIPAAALSGRLSLPLLYIVAVVVGACSVLFTVADHVFITDLVARKRLLEANSKREAIDAVAEISGPALGGALVAWLTAPIAIAVDALTFVGSAILIGGIRRRERTAASAPPASAMEDLRWGLHVVWRDPAVRALLLATATLTLCFSFMASLYTLYALRDLGLSPAELGVVIGCGGIGGLAGAGFAGRAAREWGVRRTLIGALLLGGAMQSLVPLAPPAPAVAIGFLIATQLVGDGALTVYLVNETTLRQRLLPADALGRAAAAWTAVTGVLTPTGALVGAALAETIGMRPTLWLLPCAGVVAALWLIAARRALPSH
jgi:predicted MFS family arabinose efflux permease